jgi:beta-phosphoglucomutase-like phosphatase (HAD superfamily)
MAKAKGSEQAKGETFVETAQDNDFADTESEPAARGESIGEQMDAIRERNARARAARGPVAKKRVITNYHDAERLHRLATGVNEGPHRDSFGRIVRGSSNVFPDIATAEELVQAEEDGLMPNPEHYATGSSALNVPPDEGV